MPELELPGAVTCMVVPQRESQPRTRAFAAPEVIDLTHQLAGGFYDLPALGAQVRRQRGKQFLGVGLRHSQIPNGPAQKVEILQQIVQHVVLLIGKGVVLPHLVHGLSRDGDRQDGFRPAVVLAVIRVAVRVVYGFHLGG